MIYPYKINSKDDLYRLSELACQEDFPIYISTPYGQLDARSVLGLFTIMGQEVNLVASDHSCAKEFSKFINKLESL
jgi:hypothetical protein